MSIPQGAIRINIDSNRLEFYAEGLWHEIDTHTPNLDGGARGVIAGDNPVNNVIQFFTIPIQGNGTDYFGWWGGSQSGDISSTWTLFLPNRNVTSLYVNPDNDPSSSGIGARIYIKDDSSVSGTTNAFLAFNAEL